MKEKRRHPVWIAIMWICFLSGVGLVAYLSFQDGDEAKEVGANIIEYIADATYGVETRSETQMQALTYVVRQLGRILAFFLMGIWGTLTIHVTFYRRNWLLRTIVTAALLLAIAYLTEKLKIYIPGRHFSQEEMMLSITAVILGFSLVSIITIIYHMLKVIFSTQHSAEHTA